MKIYNLKDFVRGWIVGDFEPNLLKTKEFEFGSKVYKKGHSEKGHIHKIAHEINIIDKGKFDLDGQILNEGDIIWFKPGESFNYIKCLEDGAIGVIKTPSVIGDKYFQNEI